MKNVIAIVCAAAALQLPLSAQSKLPPSAQRTFSDPSTYAPDLAERLTTSCATSFHAIRPIGNCCCASTPYPDR